MYTKDVSYIETASARAFLLTYFCLYLRSMRPVIFKECAFDIFLLKSARIIEVVAWCAGWRGALAGSRGVTYIPVNTPAQSTLATGTFGAFDELVHWYK